MPIAALTRRRAAGLAGLGVTGLGAVALGLATTGGSRTPGRRTPAAAGLARVAADPDVVVVEQARASLAARRVALRRTMRRHPELRGRLRPVVALHRSHDAVLAGGAPAPAVAAVPRVPRDPAAALAAVVVAEQALQADLTALCLRAESGALARVLASMAAGTAQRATRLAAPPAETTAP